MNEGQEGLGEGRSTIDAEFTNGQHDPILEILMRWGKPTNEQLEKSIGPYIKDPFWYVYISLKGRKRKDCDNPAITHPWDVAKEIHRFMSLFKKEGRENVPYYVIRGMMHDTIEDSSTSLDDVEEKYIEILKKFDNNISDDVFLFTNPHSLLATQAKSNKKENFLARLNSLREDMDPKLSKKYSYLFTDISDTVDSLNRYDLENLREENKGFDFMDLVKFRLYQKYYLVKLFTYAMERFKGGDPCFDMPIVVKTFDSVDALKTLSPTKQGEAGKTIKKAEMKQQMFRSFVDSISTEGHDTSFLNAMQCYFEEQMVEQIISRVRSSREWDSQRYQEVRLFYYQTLQRFKQKPFYSQALEKVIREKGPEYVARLDVY